MSLWAIAIKSVRQRALASALTSLSVALGVMLMIVVLVANGMVERMFVQTATGYDLIVGPKGSQLELVLTSIYRIGVAGEPLPYRFYRELTSGKNNRIAQAVPITMGDVTQQGSFPIVGTTPEYFALPYMHESDGTPRRFRIRTTSRDGQHSGEGLIRNPFDSAIGAVVARQNGWDVGTTLKLVHGGSDGHVHDEEFTVTGVLAATGTPNDRTVFVHLDGFYMISGHEKPLSEAVARELEFFGNVSEESRNALEAEQGSSGHAHGPVPEAQKEVTAILVNIEGTIGEKVLAESRLMSGLNEGVQAQAVKPIVQIDRMMQTLVGPIRSLLMGLTSLIIVVSGIGIFVSIYNSMADRKKEIAIMRALGARRQTVLSVILAESTLLCVVGGLTGFVLAHLMILALSPMIAGYGLVIDPWTFAWGELVLLPVLIALASLVGFVPGMTAYRTDVARTLSD
ncbi:MAG: FtsX-like permease family protein [Planctomycetota bacterium]|nr:FtsX-like permease family protein [Planctomycetota bacterium]